MSKSTITRLFVGAILAVTIGLLVGSAALIAALAGGAITFGGQAVVAVHGAALAGTLGWLVIASVAIGAGAVAAIASWVGALVNTVQLEDKTWFVVLLLLGVFSLGWVAMVAYVFVGPDASRPVVTRGAPTTAPG